MERRTSHRVELSRRAIGRVPATPIEVTVLNLSATGCLMQVHGERIAPGTTVLLNLTSELEVAGQVVRQAGDQVGLQFHHPLSAQLVMDLLGRDDPRRDIDSPLTDSFGRDLPPLSAHMRF